MMSQTHILLAAALFAKPKHKLRNTAVVAGAIVPDLAIYVLMIWAKLNAIPEQKIWHELYWQEPWQTYTAAGNSFPFYLLLLLAAVIVLRALPGLFQIGVFITFFALSAIVHIAADLPVHVADAHRHFWPLSDWKFISPVSYWNPDHHGHIFSVVEMFLGIILCAILFRRFSNLFVRIALIMLCLAYVAVPLYFTWQMTS